MRLKPKQRPEQKPVARMPVTFERGDSHVVARIHLGESTIGLRFESPEHLLAFMSQLMDEAAKVWPENEWVREYQSDDPRKGRGYIQ